MRSLWLPSRRTLCRRPPFLRVASFLPGWNGGALLGGGGGGGGTDPHIASVVLLVHFTGANGSTTFSDQSPTTPHTLTANGNAQIQSNKLELDGSGDFVSALDDADWNFGTDWTIELFGVEIDDLTANQVLISQWNAANGARSWIVSFNGTASPKTLNGGGSLDGTASTIASYQWTDVAAAPTAYNIAFERSGTTMRAYLNGTKVANATLSGALHNTAAIMRIGASGNSIGTAEIFLNGRMAAARITKGVARYATDGSYSVPSLPLPTS